VTTLEEKAEMLRWGAGFDHNIDGVMEVVKLGMCSPGRASTSFAVYRNHPLKSRFEFVKIDHDGGLW